jgi:uncharacterized protein (UPF0332 family)
MKLDKLVLKRFDELEGKAEKVNKTYHKSEYLEHVDIELYDEWSTSVLSLFKRIFGEKSDHYSNFKILYSVHAGRFNTFRRCRGIFNAAKEDYECGYLFNLKSLVSAEISEDVLEQAEKLFKSDYKDAACVLAGVALETSLKDLCMRQGIKPGNLDRMNADLRKDGKYNVSMQTQITAWYHHRNNAAHGDWGEYTSEDVKDMIKGVRRFIAEYL